MQFFSVVSHSKFNSSAGVSMFSILRFSKEFVYTSNGVHGNFLRTSGALKFDQKVLYQYAADFYCSIEFRKILTGEMGGQG